jgi:hypothetical protein
MRIFFVFHFIFLLTIAPLSGQQKFSFSFEEPFGSVNTSQSSRIVPPLQKSARLRSNRGGNLVAVIDSAVANKLSPLCSSIIENALALWSEQYGQSAETPGSGYRINDQIKISSSGIDETGIASINNSYTFTASANGKAISNYQWEYRIKKTDGTYEIKGNANTSSFSISPITSSSQYARNSDGNIIGEINLTGTVNGVSQKTTLNLYFNCIPGEIAFTTKVNRLTDWIYDIEITLQSKGAESWLVNVKNWTTGAALLKNFSDCQYLQFTVGNYSYEEEIELVFKAMNQSGYTEKSYDMPPVHSTNLGIQPVEDKISAREAVTFEAYTLNGAQVSKVASKLELNKTLPSGIYVIRSKDADENTIESKTTIIK